VIISTGNGSFVKRYPMNYNRSEHETLRVHTLHSPQKNHLRFVVHLPGKCLDLYKIFRVYLRWIRYSIDVKVEYSLLQVTSF